MEQTKVESFVETSVDMGTGVLVSWAVMLWAIPFIFPDYVNPNQAGAAFGVVMVFTVTSFIRRYYTRRMFAIGLLHKVVYWIAHFIRHQFNI